MKSTARRMGSHAGSWWRMTGLRASTAAMLGAVLALAAAVDAGPRAPQSQAAGSGHPWSASTSWVVLLDSASSQDDLLVGNSWLTAPGSGGGFGRFRR